MDKNFNYTLMYRVAKAYYIDQRTQQEIADAENFSRSQISRLLKRALDEGLVTYKVNFPGLLDEAAVSARLAQCLGLQQVALVPSFYTDYPQVDSSMVCKNLTMGAAEKLPQLLGNAEVVGIGWGRSLYNTSLNLMPQSGTQSRIFVPLIGHMGDSNPALQTNNIVDRFGESFRAERKYLHMPSLQMRSMYAADSAPLVELLHKWDELDAAVVGIGASPLDDNSLLMEFPTGYRNRVIASEACGDILSQFYSESGEIYRIDNFGLHLAAMELEKLWDVKNVIAIAAGYHKYKSICVAAENGFMKMLITDYNTAEGILKWKGVDTK